MPFNNMKALKFKIGRFYTRGHIIHLDELGQTLVVMHL